MAPSLPTSLRRLLWHTRVEERESSELGFQHAQYRKNVQPRSPSRAGPSRRGGPPSAVHPSTTSPAGSESLRPGDVVKPPFIGNGQGSILLQQSGIDV